MARAQPWDLPRQTLQEAHELTGNEAPLLADASEKQTAGSVRKQTRATVGDITSLLVCDTGVCVCVGDANIQTDLV